MKNIVNRIVENYQKFVQILKQKLKTNKGNPRLIFFRDFFICETTANKLGFTFLHGHEISFSKWVKLNSLLFQVLLFILLISELISFVLSIQAYDVDIMIDNALFFGLIFIILVKIFVIFYHNREKIQAVIQKLDEHFPHSGVDQCTFEVQKYLKTMSRIEIFYYVLCGSFTAQFCSMPILFQLYARYKSVDQKLGHIYSLNMPFDQTQPVLYEVIYIAEFWITIYSVSFAICTDLLFACLMQILVMELKILGQIISEIDVTENEDEAIKELKKLIEIHQELIEVSEKLEQTFSPLLLINSLGVIVSLCTASFLSVVSIVYTSKE